MDMTKKYIRMCEKAREIQDPSFWNPKPGDFYDSRGNTEIKGPKVLKTLAGRRFKALRYVKAQRTIYRHIWLPRQDQLQDMIECTVWFEKLYRFYEWLQKIEGIHSWASNCAKFDSMEQLWLSFVMHEKYNKIWTGTDWEVRG